MEEGSNVIPPAPDPCAAVPNCPICAGPMEVVRRAQVHICVCLECGTTLSVTDEAMTRFRNRARVV